MRFYALLLSSCLGLAACQSNPPTENKAPATATSAAAPNSATKPATPFYRRYSGTIGQLPVTLHLYRDSAQLLGFYAYQKTGQPLKLRGTWHSDSTTVEEFDTSYQGGRATGRFQGQLTAAGWQGTWTNLRTNARLPFSLREDNQDAAQLTPNSYADHDCTHARPYPVAGLDSCASVRVSWPTVVGHPGINAHLRAQVLRTVRATPGPDVQAAIHRALLADSAYSVQTATVVVVRNTGGLLVVANEWVYDGGGAHPMPGTWFYNYDLTHDRLITLTDVLVPGYHNRLSALTKKLFYQQNADNSALFDQSVFKLPDNFILTPQGLRFHFNPYDVAAYAGGAPEVLVPWAQLGSLVRPTGPAQAWVGKAE